MRDFWRFTGRSRGEARCDLRAVACGTAGPRAAASGRRLLLAGLAGAVFVAAIGATTWRTARHLTPLDRPDPERHGLEDFRVGFYYPAVALLDGVDPYDPRQFVAAYPVARSFPPYPPTMILLHVPLALLPLGLAQWAHYAVNVLLIVVLAAFALSTCGVEPTATGVLATAAALVLSRPGEQTLFLGQCTLYVVLACLAAVRWARARPGLAGASLAVACAKPTFGLPLAALLWSAGRRGAVATAAAITAVPLAALTALLAARAGGVIPLWRLLEESLRRVITDPAGDPATSLIRVDVPALLARLAGRPLGLVAEAAVGLALLGLAARRMARLAGGGRADGGPADLHAASLGAYAILACAYHQTYDGLLLVLPAVALASGRLFADRPAVRGLLLALVAAQAANYLTTYAVAARLGLAGGAWRAVASSNAVVEVLALAILLTAPGYQTPRTSRHGVACM
ncbi:MAG TPA: glycosyltransferase family 87 protein [Candidatus Binatia bacterium]|nr:glycosyltransferase family 87 protein [Candidatus Binatia bacterium]